MQTTTSIQGIIASIVNIVNSTSPMKDITHRVKDLHSQLKNILDEKEQRDSVLAVKKAAGDLFAKSMSTRDTGQANRMRKAARAMLEHDLLNKTDRFTGKPQEKMVEFTPQRTFSFHEPPSNGIHVDSTGWDSPTKVPAFVIASVYSSSCRLWCRTKNDIKDGKIGCCLVLTRVIAIDIRVNNSDKTDPNEILSLHDLLKDKDCSMLLSPRLSKDLNETRGRPKKKQWATRRRVDDLASGLEMHFPPQRCHLRTFVCDELRGEEAIQEYEDIPIYFEVQKAENVPTCIFNFSLNHLSYEMGNLSELIQQLVIRDSFGKKKLAHVGTT